MQLSDLERLGIPPRIVDAWRERQGESLLPVQRLALRRGLLSSAGNMIISAPTSSGKSFCAEMAAIKALASRKKAVLLFPLKSLAEEKYRLFQKTYGALGIKCLIATGDHPENDRSFFNGEFQLLVGIYEKFDLLLTTDLDALQNIGLVVIDELQMVAEPSRGPMLERLLTKIVAATFEPPILALSAVLDDDSANRLAKWLSAQVVQECSRPIDLIRGVAAGGSFRFRSFNSGEDGTEPFTTIEAGDDLLDSFIRRIKSGSGSTLVFLKSRQDTVRLAFKLAAAVNWPEAGGALAKLQAEEPSFLTRSLTQALTRGVAFHNSDLTSTQRMIVEESFINREIRVLLSTTTLALGINLPADTVYLETVKYVSGVYDGRPVLVPISRSDFDNMTGRAGRYGTGRELPGRAIVLADTDFDRDVLWDTYIAPFQSESIRSAFDTMMLEDWLLHMVCTGLTPKREILPKVLKCTLRAIENPSAEYSFDSVIEKLVKASLLRSDENGGLSITPLGRAVATVGLSVREALHYCRLLEQGCPETTFGWTALALSSPVWTMPPSLLTRAEQAENLPLKTLYQHFDRSVEEASCLLPADHRRGPLSYRRAASVKALLLLEDWCCMAPAQTLEERYQIHLGQIMSLGETVSHLVSALAALAEASDPESLVVERLRAHAFSLRFGLPPELRQLHRHLGAVLNRSDLAALFQAGISQPAQLCELSDKEMAAIIKEAAKLQSLHEIVNILKEEVEMTCAVATGRPMTAGEPDLIEIDGTFERERYVVRINGFPIRLTGKSFKYFTKLAWSRLNGDTGWVYKEDIEIGFNQARYLYRMKNEIAAGFGSNWPIFENNRLGYYRLSIEPGKIRINRENLSNFPDYEVRRLISGSATSDRVN